MALKLTADADDLDHLLNTGALQPHLAIPQPMGAPELGAPSMSTPLDLSSAVPILKAPTKQESQEAGKREFEAGMPQVTAEAQAHPFSKEYYDQKQAQLDYKQAHPWGSPISEHPGLAGKVGHALADVGNIVGGALAPGVTAEIPGSRLNNELQTAQNEAGEQKAQQEETAQTQANTEAAKEKLAEDQAKDTVTVAGPNGEAIQVPVKVWEDLQKSREGNQTKKDVATVQNATKEQIAQWDNDNKLALADGKPQPHITKMVDGQAHVMSFNPQTKAYDKDEGVAPPSYAMMLAPARTQNIIGADGMPHVMGWNPETQAYDKDMGLSGAGALGHEMGQAGIVQRAGTDLIADIQANKDQLGNLSAWVKKYGLNTPIANPKLAQLQAELGTFAALQPAMHGFRGGNALETFENIIGGLQKNPDATIASIQGILKTAGAINPIHQNDNKPKGPEIGTTRVINGQDAYWDGHGWLAGKPPEKK